MTIRLVKFYLILLLSFLFATGLQVHATVEWSIQSTLKTIAQPIDVAVFPDGRSILVLTDDGIVRIYDEHGKLTDTIPVGTHVDQIKIDPLGERLFATSRQKKTVEVITLDFIRDINLTGAPFKGPQDAPVIITVFSDFQ